MVRHARTHTNTHTQIYSEEISGKQRGRDRRREGTLERGKGEKRKWNAPTWKRNVLFISQVETGTGGQSAVKGSSLFVSPLQQPRQLKRCIPLGRILSFDLPCPTMAAVSTIGMDSTRYNATKRPPMPRFDDVEDSPTLLLCLLYVSWFFYLSPSFSLFIGFLRTKLYAHTCPDAQDAVYTGGYGGQADSLCGFVPRLSCNRRANEVQNDWEKAITENAAYRNAGKLADEVRLKFENGPFEVSKSVALLYAVSRWLRCLERFENNDFYYSARS